MKGKTHLVLGLAAGVTIALNREIDNFYMIILGTSIGSLMPDIDHPKSRINQKLLKYKNKSYKILFYTIIGMALLYIYSQTNDNVFLLAGVISILIGVSKHRGFTHSILGMFLFMKLGSNLVEKFGYYDIYLGFFIGYISHLFSDFFTKSGMEIFYPFSENFSFPVGMKTGGALENAIIFILGSYSFYGILKYFGLISY
ncbi:metal-dependent hydrolase [Clostridium sp. D2Q-11]|uniref:Metal-dependent hydrolase n=1 Tax=Anaeromonas frigoriresistens TaxID=2683708 RepID=A0A942Z674_9FIRM|nr:metal-dependent hydrolase [Anaeromonas frigoriresistens]MBS4537277.1 metal-dependent hydrolase [Anaeromonas frigoriresistens]